MDNRGHIFVLTESAQKEIIRQNKSKIIRFGVRAGGCNGYSYVFEYSENINDKDYVFEFGEIKIIIDPKSMNYVNGTTIDFIQGIQGHGFQINNPNKKSNCGCGESFNV